jgi:hypothetical protein
MNEEQLKARISELEAKLADTEKDLERYKSITCDLSEAEIHDMLHGPRGESIESILARHHLGLRKAS